MACYHTLSSYSWEWLFSSLPSLSYPELGWPEILCCFACTWTSTSSINKIQRNYEGLKIPACLCRWGKLWTTGYKKTKSATATFEELGAKTGCQEQKRGTVDGPCLSTTEGVGRPQIHASSQATGPAPTHTPCQGPAWPSAPRPHFLREQASQETCFLFSLCSDTAGSPIKFCLNYLSGLLSISID